MFEIFASKRAVKIPFDFFTLRLDLMQREPTIQYVYTGIIKGKWKTDCVPLFEREGIPMDFSARGMYEERGRLKSRSEVAWRLAQKPQLLLRSLRTLL